MNKICDALIIGGDGLIGGAISSHLSQLGLEVIATSRHADAQSKGKILFDLSNERLFPLPNARIVFVCAAITQSAQCFSNPSVARTVNVTNTNLLIKGCVAQDSKIVFLSSSAVLGGEAPEPNEVSPVNPVGEYARMKLEVEQQITKLTPNHLIIRLTKVLPNDFALFKTWRTALQSGEIIHPFSNLRIAPISLQYATSQICSAALSSLQGLIHVSASADITYADCAYKLADALGAKREMVQPQTCPVDQPEYQPRFATLSSVKINCALPSPWEAVDGAITSLIEG